MPNSWANSFGVDHNADYFGMTRKKLPTPTVLVVDDEPLIRWSLSEGLADAGYAVRQAASGAEALEALAVSGKEPLIVVLDLRLPDVHDLSLLRNIRASRPEVPVVIMTAHGTSEDAREATRLGRIPVREQAVRCERDGGLGP